MIDSNNPYSNIQEDRGLNIQLIQLNTTFDSCLQWSLKLDSDIATQFKKSLEPILVKLDEHPLLSIREFTDLEDGSWAVNLDPVDFRVSELLAPVPPYYLNALEVLIILREWLTMYAFANSISVYFKSYDLNHFAIERFIDEQKIPHWRLRLIALEQLTSEPNQSDWRATIVEQVLEYLSPFACFSTQVLYGWLKQLFSLDLPIEQYIDYLNKIGIKSYVHSVSDTGQKRKNNEDNLMTAVIEMQPTNPAPHRALLLVCDGMGGHLAGEVASDFVCTQLGSRLLYLTQQFYQAPDTHTTISGFANEVNLHLSELASQNPNQSGMGTTVTGAIITRRLNSIGGRVLTFNIGDSRTYSFDAVRYQRLTKDHSYVQQELVDKGVITPEEAFQHPNSNVITRCIGGHNNSSEPDCKDFPIGGGTILLACSDGLTDALTERDIAFTVRKYLAEPFIDIAQIAFDLVLAANSAGGPDNISIAIANIEWVLPAL